MTINRRSFLGRAFAGAVAAPIAGNHVAKHIAETSSFVVPGVPSNKHFNNGMADLNSTGNTPEMQELYALLQKPRPPVALRTAFVHGMKSWSEPTKARHVYDAHRADEDWQSRIFDDIEKLRTAAMRGLS